MAATSLPLAFSYIRFSTPEQLKGDSLRRQTKGTADWCEKNGVVLDTSISFEDLGVSAFKGKHRAGDKHRLAQFLKLANQGRIPRDSYLVIENLDRLTREDERTALRLWMDILDAGINIVQLHPETVFRHEKSDMMDIMRAIIELSRGHSESRIKSERVGEAWERRRVLVREGRCILTHKLPAWIQEVNGVLQLDAKPAAAVHRIYQLATAGLGAGLIVRSLQEGGYLPFGPSGAWSRAYVTQVLTDRRACGEMQPRHANGRPAGPAIPDYFPSCVTEDEWFAARAALGSRRIPRGRVGNHVNIFAGLLFNAREQDVYYVTTRTNQGKHHRVMVNRNAMEKSICVNSFPYPAFELGILSKLKELDPQEVLGTAPGQEEIIVLSGELAHVQNQQSALAAELLKGDVATLAKAARALDQREKEITEQLAAAKQQAAYPQGEAWGEAVSLVTILEKAENPKELRLKLRSLLRRLIDSIWILAVGRGRDRLAAVQVYFHGDGHRDYIILSRPPKANGQGWRVEGGWWARSFADMGMRGKLDLRNPEHVQQLEAALLKVDLSAS